MAQTITTKGTLKELQKVCNEVRIPIFEEITKIDEAWEGKAKGLLQVCGE